MRVYIVYIRYIQYIHERSEKVQIIISNNSDKPIYEQITTQIKNMIMITLQCLKIGMIFIILLVNLKNKKGVL